METVKIPLKIFTSYEALTEYYGENNTSLELGMYESSDELVVGHAPTAYSFSPQYFTGEVPIVPNYVPDSPFGPEPTPVPPTEPPAGGVADPVLTYFLSPVDGENYSKLCVNATCETVGATTYLTISSDGTDMGPYDFELWKQMGTVEKDGVVYVKTINLGPGEDMGSTATISSYAQLGEDTSSTVTATATYEPEPTPTTEAPTPTTQAPVVDYSEPFWIQPEYKANIAILNNLSFPMNIEYSTDKTNWTTITDWSSKICYITSAGQTTTLTYDDGFAGGTKIWFRGTNTAINKTIFVEGDDDYMLSFNPYMEGSVSFNTGGNIMSLVYGANFTNQTTLPKYMSIGGDGCRIHPFNVMLGPSEYQVNALNMINSAEELLAISTDWYIDMYDASVETYPIYDIETITNMCDYLFESSTGLTEIHCTAIYNDTEWPCTQFLPTGVAGPNAKFYVNANTQVDWTQLVDTAEWTILIEGTNTPWSPSNN